MEKIVKGTGKKVTGLIELKNYLNSLSREELDLVDLTSLPTWGEGPENTYEIFSWNTTGAVSLFLVCSNTDELFSIRTEGF